MQKLVKIEDIPKYLDEGWVYGMLPKKILERCWVHHTTLKKHKLIEIKERDCYLSQGWKLGML